MTAWERVRDSAVCGNCGRRLTAGDPVFVFTFVRGSLRPLRLLRCDPCAGSAPPNLPAVIVRAIGTDAPRVALGPWAEREARELLIREPGEEG